MKLEEMFKFINIQYYATLLSLSIAIVHSTFIISTENGVSEMFNNKNATSRSNKNLTKIYLPVFGEYSSTISEDLNESIIINSITQEDLIHPYVVPAVFFEEFTVQLNRTTEYIFEYVYNTSLIENKALRITVHCPSSLYTYPLLVVVRQQRGILSWQLPLEPPPNTFTLEAYKQVSRTLCPVDNIFQKHGYHALRQRLFVDVSTSSPVPLKFSAEVSIVDGFMIGLESSRTVTVSPGESAYYMFQFPDEVDMVLVKATSEDDICAMVSIQNISCPVFDTEENIQYGKFYQTMTFKAGITVRRQNYPSGFYIIVVTLSNDEKCAPNFQHIYRHREKEVTISVEEKITYLEYLAAIFAGLGYCAFFYVVTVVLRCVEYIRAKKRALSMGPLLDDSLIGAYGGEGERDREASHSCGSTSTKAMDSNDACAISVCSSLAEEEYDILEDAESEKDVFRTKTFLFVSDLARKDTKVLKHKSCLYILGLLTIAIFYAVPVVQLVATYQKVLDVTGNQDICFYNFWCAHPLGPLSDFNHVYSNVAYILFGVLFVGLCANKEMRHRKASKIDRNIDKYYGIPQHYGMFYAMGGALIMEGLLSGCYHICPNYSNFQFDTAFMYVIAVLCMLKIYQTRHPDVNASANATYLALAFAVLVGVIGVLDGSLSFWVIFSMVHLTVCCLLSGHIYYMGRWKVSLSFVRRFPSWLRGEMRNWRTLLRPTYCDRMILLLMANAANWALSLYGAFTTPKDFASYLLIIFVTNLLLYIGFYIIMKIRHGERLLVQPLVYLLLCMFSWGASAYFYLVPETTWELSPAHSRQFNAPCSLLHFYDLHDVWHFLSSSAMFFGFMLLLTLDDDLVLTSREKIPVF